MKSFTLLLAIITTFYPKPIFASVITVKEGETLSEIALRHNTTVNKIIMENNLINKNQIYPGQKLKIPEIKRDPKVYYNKKYTVRAGENISTISKKFGINSSTLMKANNLSKRDYIFPGQELNIPEKKKPELKAKSIDHIVKRGETISKIATNYNIKKSLLISNNRIKNENQLFIGQSIKIPIEKVIKQTNPEYHEIRPGESIDFISKKYKISSNELIKINNISNPRSLSIGRKIYLQNSNLPIKPKDSDQKIAKSQSFNLDFTKPVWKQYGPLKVDWANWQLLSGSHITPTLNKEGKPFYLAINCEAKKLNATEGSGVWREWVSPMDNFEKALINDLCKAKNNQR